MKPLEGKDVIAQIQNLEQHPKAASRVHGSGHAGRTWVSSGEGVVKQNQLRSTHLQYKVFWNNQCSIKHKVNSANGCPLVFWLMNIYPLQVATANGKSIRHAIYQVLHGDTTVR
jgi:hypothetical protein